MLTHPPSVPPLLPCLLACLQPGLLPVPAQLFQGSLLLGGMAKLGLTSGEAQQQHANEHWDMRVRRGQLLLACALGL